MGLSGAACCLGAGGAAAAHIPWLGHRIGAVRCPRIQSCRIKASPMLWTFAPVFPNSYKMPTGQGS